MVGTTKRWRIDDKTTPKRMDSMPGIGNLQQKSKKGLDKIITNPLFKDMMGTLYNKGTQVKENNLKK